jgi:hypothetical protein
MKSFWANAYDSYKDRRYAVLFVSSLLLFLGLLLGAAFLEAVLREYGHEEYFWDILPFAVGLVLASGILKLRQVAREHRDKLRRGPLSRDELRVARSKLQNGMKPISRPAPRPPDMDLKY